MASSLSSDGQLFATAGADTMLKIFDVSNFDLINIIPMDIVPLAISWIFPPGHRGRLQVVVAGPQEMRIYKSNCSDKTDFTVVTGVHQYPVVCIQVRGVS